MTMYLLMDTMTYQLKAPIHVMKVDTKEGNPLEVEEEGVPRHEAWHGDNLFEYYGKNPNVGRAYFGGYYGRQKGDKALDKIKWKVPSFKGGSDPNVLLDWEHQVENQFMVRNYSDVVKVKLVIAAFSGYELYWKIANQLELYPYNTYEDMCHLATKIENLKMRSGLSITTLPSSRNVVPKPQSSTYKSCPKKDEKPKVVFKDNSKPKVEEKGRLITNPTRSFKCDGVGHIAIKCPTKKTLVFCENLNGSIEKDEEDCQEENVEKE
ncbi:hypothetical protein M9H77_30152 [Catharanthus roseus]|uniref:Uncharacterized protein n=1 Tax=Catharanthus roseus TaxID=4058 RepID=A0ACB9ZXH2_CATRO|nr:hypothetical protein M9H77_30152 [Catharanthus roseus]